VQAHGPEAGSGSGSDGGQGSGEDRVAAPGLFSHL
jgi:hypothetical protein